MTLGHTLSTPDRYKPLLDRSFLKSELYAEYELWIANDADADLTTRLDAWVKRELRGETQAEAAFIQRFFVEIWGYLTDGGGGSYNLQPQFPIEGSGQGGGTGRADLGIGVFGSDASRIPQVVCEFKDMRSGLDAPQNRKGNSRSPVLQARDYIAGARRGLFGNEAVLPRYFIVTDMDEFRLYWWDQAPDRYIRFKLRDGDLFNPSALLGKGGATEDARFDRFLFWRLFQPDMLLGEGRTRLERLIARQGKAEKKLEGQFYREYTDYRRLLFNSIVMQRPGDMTKGGALQLAQKLLDRFIFVMFAEDMGGRIAFPPHLLKDMLGAASLDRFFDPDANDIWTRMKRLFGTMDAGGAFGGEAIPHVNGGLFQADPAIDALDLPNRLFCRRGQAKTDANIAEHKETLLYLSATYNFAAEGDAKDSIGLYTLGHIFEQSIVELEALEADADGRPSLTKLSKRKRDGVYYTPEWAVRRIIEDTLEPLFSTWRRDAGWPETGEPSPEAAGAYWARLKAMRIIDPACGSGAFLITALRYLTEEFRAAGRRAVTAGMIGTAEAADDAITDWILAHNLYGVDINTSSVEITRLSLWLHTARAGRPLSSLDHNIRCGNSLVDTRFYNVRSLYEGDELERINAFDWWESFPEVAAAGGFDAVIGNPPYVKLQNFKQVNADTARWLLHGSTGEAPYQSTTTGNFDLYLPFIEKGLALLNSGGRMGYIAPNLWPTLEYGEALRGLVHAGRHLERWLDFRSFQVFEEATIYTAIQIFSKAPAVAIRLGFAPDGDVGRINWNDPDLLLPYDEISGPRAPWLMAPRPVRTMMTRLGREARRLDHTDVTRAVFQGVITSADHIFHLRRMSRNRYEHTPKSNGKKQRPIVVEIEDTIMKPLISGAEAKRFMEPDTGIYALFPYDLTAGIARLWTDGEMQDRFPLAWAYLCSYEDSLKTREKSAKPDPKTGKRGPFDDNDWYRYGRSQNLGKQEIAKVIVPRLVVRLKAVADDKGKFYCDNVDVGGVIPRDPDDVWLLTGILNSPATNTMFSWLSKPFRGDYLSANKQFIAPLPVPIMAPAERTALSALAKRLQADHTERSQLRGDLDDALGRAARGKRSFDWLLPDVRSIAALEALIPATLAAPERRKWVDDMRETDEDVALARVNEAIRLNSTFDADVVRGTLRFLSDDAVVASAIVSPDAAPLLLAQWRSVALTFEPSGREDGKRLIDRLRHVAMTAAPEIGDRIVECGSALENLTNRIRSGEAELHETTCKLFNLSPAERRLVERGR